MRAGLLQAYQYFTVHRQVKIGAHRVSLGAMLPRSGGMIRVPKKPVVEHSCNFSDLLNLQLAGNAWR
jgi:hypothetical protein